MDNKFDVEQRLQDAIDMAGGRFQLTALLEKRMKSLLSGSQRLVKDVIGGPFETAFAELLDGKIEMKQTDNSGGGNG